MNLDDANAVAEQLGNPQVREKLAAASSVDPSGLVDLADLAVEATPVAVELAGGLFEAIGELLAGILS